MAIGYIDSNGNRYILSGMRTGELPKYTMAEYTALTNKPIDWICTDYDATSEYGINATEVKYDNTNVKVGLDNATAYKTGDSITFSDSYCIGVYESSTQLRFAIQLPKSISNISSGSVSLTKCEVYHAGTDVNQTSNVTSTSVAKKEPNQLFLVSTGNFSGSPSTRTPVLVVFSGTVTFS